MPETPKHTDPELMALLKSDSDKAIDILFRLHYAYMCKSIYRIIPNREKAEDIAQDVFYELWKKRETLEIKTSIRAYLKRAMTNKALNYIRDQRMKFDSDEDHPYIQNPQASSQQHLEAEELQKAINDAIKKLPERCRIVFSLSRFEELSYKEIAKNLDISVKTVENQISKALKLLRLAIANRDANVVLLAVLELFF